MEENFSASLLVVAGLLRLAGASKSEPLPGDSTHQSFLEESLVTSKGHPVSVREDDAQGGVTLQFDSLTSDHAGNGVSHVPEPTGTTAKQITGGGGQLPTVFAGQPLDGASLGHQSDAPLTSSPLIGRGVLTGVQGPKAESSSLPTHSATFLLAEERSGYSAADEFSRSVRLFFSSKAAGMELLATGSESSKRAEQRATLSTSLSLATAPGNPHRFSLVKNETEPEANETVQASRIAALGKLLALLPRSSQATSQPDRTLAVSKTLGFLVQSPYLKGKSSPNTQQPLLEEDVAVIPRIKEVRHPSSASSPHEEMMDPEPTGLRRTGKPILWTPSQGITEPFPFLPTPGPLPSETVPQPALLGDIDKSKLSKRAFPSRVPFVSESGVSTGLEDHLHERMNLTVRHATDPQTSHFELSRTSAAPTKSFPASKVQETSIRAPIKADSKPQPLGIPPPLRGKLWESVPSTGPLANSPSPPAGPPLLAIATSSHVEPPSSGSTALSTPPGNVTQALSKSRPPSTYSSSQREPPSPATFVSSLAESRPSAIVFAPPPTEPPTLSLPGTDTLDTVTPFQDEPPQPPSERSPVTSAASHTESPTTGTFASLHARPDAISGTDSAPSRLKVPGLSTLPCGELQGTSGASHVEQQMLSGSSLPRTQPAAAGATSHVELAARQDVSEMSDLAPTVQKVSAAISLLSYAKRPPLPTGVYATAQPPSTPVPAHREPQVSIVGEEAPSHASKLVGGSSTEVPYLLVTSVPAPGKPKMDEMPAEGSLPVHMDAISQRPAGPSVLIHANAPSLLSSAHAAHPLSDVPAKSGAKLGLHKEMPAMSVSAPDHLRLADTSSLGQPKSQASGTSAFIHGESQPPHPATTAEAEARMPGTPVSVNASPVLSSTPRTPAEKSEGTSSSQTSLLASQAGAYKPFLPAVSALLSGRTPPFVSLVSQISHHKLPLLSRDRVEDNVTDLRTTPVLAVAGTQDFMPRSLDFIQHFKQSDDTMAGSLESEAASGFLGIPASLQQYLLLLVQGAGNMVCLSPPMQKTNAPSREPDPSRWGVGMTQEMLALTPFLGSSYPGALNLIQVSPSRVLLVKPMFAFFLADKPDVPFLPSVGEHQASPSFTNEALLGVVSPGGSLKQPMEASPTLSTLRNSKRTNTLSTGTSLSSEQIISRLIFNTFLKYITGTGQARSDTSTANPFIYGMREFSTRTKMLKNKSQDEGNQDEGFLEIPGFQEPEEKNPVLSFVEHHDSVTSPVTVSVQQRSKTLPGTNEQLGTFSQITSLQSLMGSSQKLTSSLQTSRMTGKAQLSTGRMIRTGTPPPDSVTPIAPVIKNFEESLSASSTAGNTELPLEARQHLTPARPTSRSSLSTELAAKPPLKIQYTPNAVSSFLTLSTGQRHSKVEALNDSYLGAAAVFPMATGMPSSHMKATVSKSSKHHPISPKSPMANERLSSQPLPIPGGTQIQATGEQTTGHHVLSRPSADISPQGSAHSYLAKLALKYNLSVPVVTVSLAELPGPRVSTGEGDTRAKETETHNQTEAMSWMPTMADTDSGHPSPLLVLPELGSTSAFSYGMRDFQRGVHKLQVPHTDRLLATRFAFKDTVASPAGGEVSLLEVAHGPVYRLSPSVSRMRETAFSPPSVSKDRGETAGPTAQLPMASVLRSLPTNIEGDHLERPSLDGERARDAGSSLPSLGNTPSSVISAALSAAPFLDTSFSPGATPSRLIGWAPDQNSHVQSLATTETSLTLQSQVQPTLERLSDTTEAVAAGDVLEDAPRKQKEPRLYAVGEQITSLSEHAPHRGAADPGATLLPWDAGSSVSERKARYQRRLHSDGVFLDGFAIVSDDICSSGNYTTAMSLRRAAAGKRPPSPDSFLALITLQDNSSHPTLRVQSCCVTPTARPVGPDATCCLLSRSPAECRHIQLLQNGKSQMASFTIQLFQMLNHSVAYLHCELHVCLTEHAGCKRRCLENRETLSKPSDRSSYKTLHNVISLGPVLKAQTAFESGQAVGSNTALMLLFLLGSLIGTAALMGTIVFIGLHRRHRTKMAASMEHQGMCTP